jgi:hypothetical protein
MMPLTAARRASAVTATTPADVALIASMAAV